MIASIACKKTSSNERKGNTYGLPGHIPKYTPPPPSPPPQPVTKLAPPPREPLPLDPNFKVPTLPPPKAVKKPPTTPRRRPSVGIARPEHIPDYMPPMPPFRALKHDPRSRNLVPAIDIKVDYEMFREIEAKKKRSIEDSLIRFQVAVQSGAIKSGRRPFAAPSSSYLEVVNPKDQGAPKVDIFPPRSQYHIDKKKKFRQFSKWLNAPNITFEQAAAVKGHKVITKKMRKENKKSSKIKSVEGRKFLESLLKKEPKPPHDRKRFLNVLCRNRRNGRSPSV